MAREEHDLTADFDFRSSEQKARDETAAELERANARIEELVNVLTIISTANVPINRNDFPRAFDTLRAIAQDALANATPNEAEDKSDGKS